MRRPKIVDRIREALKAAVPNGIAILYGSEARGDARPDSDIDLLILTDGERLPISEEEKILSPLYDIEVETGIPISVRIMPKSLWFNRPFATPFSINVNNEGIQLL